jgi:hypothetical protein
VVDGLYAMVWGYLDLISRMHRIVLWWVGFIDRVRNVVHVFA